MGKIEDKIKAILSQPLAEEVSYEVIGGPSPSETLKGPLDYAKNVKKATVPQAYKIPGVGEIGSDEADENGNITAVVDNLGEDEDMDDEDGDMDDKKKDDLDETFASLLAKLAEEEDDKDEDEDDEDLDEAEGETSLMDDNGGEPNETLPDVDSELDSPEKLVTKAPGIKVAEAQAPAFGDAAKSGKKIKVNKKQALRTKTAFKTFGEEEGETSLQDDNGGEPDETLPTVDSLLDSPEKLVTPAKGAKTPDVAEDIKAIFAGTQISEAGRAKATSIFKAAVARQVNEEKQRVQRVATKKLKEAYAVLKSRTEKKQEVFESNLTGQVDNYLNYVVENWMDDNRLAVERGIRAELAEGFIKGLKNLFTEHYIEVPDSKVDVLATLGKKVSSLEAKLNEAVESNVKMRASLSSYRKEEVVRVVSAGLPDTSREKLKKLSEGVEYTTRKEYAAKLNDIKEAYFPKTAKAVKREEQPLMESAPAKKVSNEMAVYSDQLNRMLKND